MSIRRRASVASLVVVAGAAMSAQAQVINWNAGSGAWNNAANWNPMNVPDTAAEDAVLGGSGAYMVSLAAAPGINPTIGSLMLTNPSAQLLIEGGRLLTLSNPASSNNGLILVNPNGSGATTSISLTGPVSLSGSGQIHLQAGGSLARITGLGTLTNGAMHTIRGVGQINVPSTNMGVIRADMSLLVGGANSLQFTTSADCANSGTLSSGAGSFLDFSSMQVTQTGAGQLLCDGGQFRTTSATITGGAINTTGSGSFNTTGGTSTLAGVTINAPVLVGAGTTMAVAGAGVTNNNNILVNDAGVGATTIVRFDASGSLGGTGELRLRATGGNAQLNTATGMTVTNGASHMIRGSGQVNAALVNNGRIRADASAAASGNSMVLQLATKTNNGTMEAATGSVLSISSITVDQTGGGALVGDDGEIALNSAAILGGQFTSVGGGLLRLASGTSVLNSLTLNGPMDITAGRTGVVAGAGLMNNGLVRINPDVAGASTILRFDEDGVLAGAGEVRLCTNAGNAQLNTAAGVVITHGATHLIRGVGNINAGMVNNGTVMADTSVAQAGFPLVLQLTNKVNNATIGAAPSSELQITSITIDQTGGGQTTITGPNSQVSLSNATIDGGSVNATGGGVLVASFGTSVLRNVTLNTPTDIVQGRVISATGSSMTNNGLLRINPGMAGAQTILRFDETGALSGTGEIRLMTNSGNAQFNTGLGVTVTQAATHTIRGVGLVNASMVNNGTIMADDSVGQPNFPLVLQGLDKVNNASIGAAAGSELQVNGITIDQTGGGTITATGADSQVSLTNATILGGSINATGGGGLLAAINGTSILRNVTLNTPTDILASRAISVTGAGLTNNGLMRVNSSSAGAQTFLRFDESGDLGGTGEVALLVNATNSQLFAGAGVTINHRPGHRVTGIGQLSGTGSIANHGLIAPGTAGAGTLTSSTSLTNAADGTIHIEIGGTSTTQFDRFIGSGTYNLGGTLDVDLIGGYVPARGHNMRIIAGSSVSNRFTTVLRPTLPVGVAMRVVYLSNAVDVYFHCPPDLSTGAIPGQVGYGVPNGTLNNDDFFFYLGIFAAGDPDADLTTGAIPGQPGYGVPNGIITNDDFFYFLTLFAGGC